jgi:hypothetical protein
MSLFSKPVKAPDPVAPVNTAFANEQLDAERRKRAENGGRGSSFLWDAEPIAAGQAKPSLFGQGG